MPLAVAIPLAYSMQQSSFIGRKRLEADILHSCEDLIDSPFFVFLDLAGTAPLFLAAALEPSLNDVRLPAPRTIGPLQARIALREVVSEQIAVSLVVVEA